MDKRFPIRNSDAFFLFLVLILSILISLGTGCTADNSDTDEVASPDPVAAALSEDWQGVIDILEPGYDSLPPEKKLVLGHAYLAVNRNNDSLCVFMDVTGEEEFSAWNAWSEELTDEHPGNRIAHYFLGDSHARKRNWEKALASYNTILGDEDAGVEGISPGYYLALNARGVVKAATGEFDDARSDFQDATEAKPDFADAFSSIGSLAIHRKDGADGALVAYNKTLELASDSVLALSGRGAINTILGEWDQADQDFNDAQHYSLSVYSCLGDINLAVEYNYSLYYQRVLEEIDEAMQKTDRLTGTTLYDTFGDRDLTHGMLEHGWSAGRIDEGALQQYYNMAVQERDTLLGAGDMLSHANTQIDGGIGSDGWHFTGSMGLDQNYWGGVGSGLSMQGTDRAGVADEIFQFGQTHGITLEQPNTFGQLQGAMSNWAARVIPTGSGGVDTEEEMGIEDLGEWDAIAAYGLYIDVEPDEEPLPEGKEQNADESL